jgi:type II secretory pathway pseudopilin PulG
MVLRKTSPHKRSARTCGIGHATGNIGPGSRESGYVLLTLLLVVALLVVAMAAVVPSIAFQIRRDREEELIHRGVQYSRAIRAYFKKFGRYPTKLEDLESANNLRFLRKRYKDPINGQDFKLLHFGEVKMFGSPIAGASAIAGANPAQPGPFGSGNGPGATSSPLGFGAAPPPTNAADPNAQVGVNQAPGTDSSQALGTPQAPSGDSKGSSGQPSGPTFGGGPIVGVVSISKKEGIREFNHKKKYEEWQFIYDPSTDRGGLLSTPNQPPLQGAAGTGNQLGQQPQQNQNSSPFSSQPAPGMLNNPSSNPTPSNPPQQQQ